jgi:hypothetical protein
MFTAYRWTGLLKSWNFCRTKKPSNLSIFESWCSQRHHKRKIGIRVCNLWLRTEKITGDGMNLQRAQLDEEASSAKACLEKQQGRCLWIRCLVSPTYQPLRLHCYHHTSRLCSRRPPTPASSWAGRPSSPIGTTECSVPGLYRGNKGTEYNRYMEPWIRRKNFE